MPTKAPLTVAIALLSSFSHAADFVEIIDNRDYAELKSTLYTEQPNVLSRESGFSLLDYAIAKKDQRAAIIIADYNNSSLSKKRLQIIEIEIKNLQSILSEASNNSEIEEQIANLESERESLKNELREATATKIDAKLKHIDPDLKSLQEKVAALEAAQSESKKSPFSNEDIVELTEKVNSMQSAYTTEEIAELIAKVDTLEKTNKEQIEIIKLEIANTVVSLKSLRGNESNKAEIDALIDGLEARVRSLEGKVMPTELKNATFNSRDIFKEKIDL